jgi:hypothetical protein
MVRRLRIPSKNNSQKCLKKSDEQDQLGSKKN